MISNQEMNRLKTMNLKELTDTYSHPQWTSLLKDHRETEGNPCIEALIVYPIKGCAPLFVRDEWGVSSTGLFGDRLFAISQPNRKNVNLKVKAELAYIKPFIDIEKEVLIVHNEILGDELDNLILPLQESYYEKNGTNEIVINGSKISAQDCGDEAAEWFSHITGSSDYRVWRQCQLRDSAYPKHIGKLSFAGDAQLLLISTASVIWLNEMIEESTGFGETDLLTFCLRFRPSMIISGAPPLAEEKWDEFRIKDIKFKMVDGCPRCPIINRDPFTLQMGVEPLRTIKEIRPEKYNFGMFVTATDYKPNTKIMLKDSLII